jgi:hypothetical protein
LEAPFLEMKSTIQMDIVFMSSVRWSS